MAYINITIYTIPPLPYAATESYKIKDEENMKMKNLKKLLALGLTAALTFALTACGGTGSSADGSATGSAAGSSAASAADSNAIYRTLDEIKESGTINIGVFSDKNPFGYVDENGEYQGYDVYFARKLAEDLGVEANFVST